MPPRSQEENMARLIGLEEIKTEEKFAKPKCRSDGMKRQTGPLLDG